MGNSESIIIDNSESSGKNKIYTFKQGVYIGDVKNNLPHGYGICKYFNGSEYDGQFKYGYPHGKGVFTYSNGITEEGEFKTGKLVNDNKVSPSDRKPEGDEQTCKVCMDNKISVLLLPCKHNILCISCSNVVESCPECRTSIKTRISHY